MPEIRAQVADASSASVDIGSSPGGWTEALSEVSPSSKVVGIDPGDMIETVTSRPNVTHLRMFLRSRESFAKLREVSPLFSCAVSDVNLPPPVAANILGDFARAKMLSEGARIVLTLKLTAKNARERALQISEAEKLMRAASFDEIGVHHLFANTEHERTLTARFRTRAHRVYCGTYTSKHGHILGDELGMGIHSFSFDSSSGALAPINFTASADPSFVAVSPDGRFVFSVNEIGGDGGITSHEVDQATGALSLRSHKTTLGAHPCHCSVDENNTLLLCANYSGGSVASFRISEDGSLSDVVGFVQFQGTGVDVARQEAAHAHQITRRGDFAYVCDLGSDKIWQLKVLEDGRLELLDGKGSALSAAVPGSGPRHLTFHPFYNVAYCMNEMAASVSTLGVNDITGKLKLLTTVEISAAVSSSCKTLTINNGADIHVSPDGRLLVASTRGADIVTGFNIDGNGALSAPLWSINGGGSIPRSFSFSPLGDFLLVANQDSHNVTVFKVDRETGTLTESGNEAAHVGSPVSVAFCPY
jgi:6-phosphogluconolactonase